MKNGLKKVMTLGMLMVMTISLLAACGSSNNKTNTNTSTNTPKQVDTSTTSTPTEAAVYDNGLPKDEEVTLKVGFFVGGYGREWFDYAVSTFTDKYPNVKFDITASPDMKTMLSTRIQANNDKDMFDLFNTDPAGGITSLVNAGKLEPLDDIWEYPLSDLPDKKVKDLMLTGMYESTPSIDGKKYEFATASSFGGLFFNKKLFEEHGWNQNPKTWSEFTALLADIKADGITPLTFPGMHPNYHSWGFGPVKEFELADINGHADEYINNFRTYNSAQYTTEESLDLWNRIYELGKLGYFPSGLAALNHTQSQMQVIQGDAAMVLTGTHVENEMKESTPADFEWGYMIVPLRDSVDQPLWVRSGTSNFNYVWAAKPELNKKWVKEFIVWMVSMDVQKFTAENAGALPMRKDMTDNEENLAKLSSSAKAVLTYIDENKAKAFKASRSVSLSDPSLAQAEKLVAENIVKFALGLQDPKPILEEAEVLLQKAVEAEKK